MLLSTAAGIHQTIDYLWATTLPSTDLVMLVILSIIKRHLSLLNVIHILDVNHHFIILPPPADLNIICFPFQDPLHCLQLLNFSRMIKKCQSYFCLGFYKLGRWPFVWKLLFFFLFRNQLFKFQRSCLFKSNNCNEIKRCKFWKYFLKV